MPDTNTNYIFGTGSIPIQIKTAQLATFADGTTKQQGYQVAEINKLISTMLTGWDANGNKPKSMSDNFLELILSCDNGFVVKKRLQFPHIIAWQNDSTPYNIADVYKPFSLDNWLKADDFENPDITLVVEPTDEILTTSTATPPEVTTTNSGRFYLYYRNLPVGVNRIHIDFHIKTKTEPIDFDLEVIDGLSWKDAQVILASNDQAKINVLLGTVKDVYKFTGAEGNFEEITMHEWNALYQQIITLNPNNRFTHDLYFYIYDESELNTKITELESKVSLPLTTPFQGYIDKDSGKITLSEYFLCSDFIPLPIGSKIIYKIYGGNNAIIACYNSNKEYLKNLSILAEDGNKNYEGIFTIPDGVSYIRFDFFTLQGSKEIQVVFPNGLEGYVLSLKEKLNQDIQEINQDIQEINQDIQDIPAISISEVEQETEKTDISSNLLFTQGKYYSQSSSDLTISEEIMSSLSLITSTDIIEGNQYLLILNNYTAPEGNLARNYFIFAESANKAVIYASEIPKYVKYLGETKDGNYKYRLVIPNGCTIFYSAVSNDKTSIVKLYKASFEKELKWLKVNPNNIYRGDIDAKEIDITNQIQFIDGQYYQQNSEKGISTEINKNISTIAISVIPGKEYLLKLNQLVEPTGSSLSGAYFIFAKSTTEAAISRLEIPNYVSFCRQVEELYYYKLTIPANCTMFYSSVLISKKSIPSFYELETHLPIKWLRVEEENMPLDFGSSLIQRAVQQSITTVKSDLISESKIYHLWESIKKPIAFQGKKLVAFGDSITVGVASPGLIQAGENKYISQFCSMVGAILENNAVSGSCLADEDGVNTSIYDKVTQFTGEADIIWIAGGTNDWNTGKTVGEYGDIDTHTTYGALKGICEYLRTNYPNAVVIFVTPIPYTKPEYSYPNHIAELNEYRTAIYDVATTYGYNVIDGLSLGMPRMLGGWNNVMCDDSDGCHPTIEGHKLYARSLTGKLI